MNKLELPRIEDDKRTDNKLANVKPGKEIVLHLTGKSDIRNLKPILEKHGERLKIHLLLEINELTIENIATWTHECIAATAYDVGGVESVDYTLQGWYAAVGDYGRMVLMLGRVIDKMDATLPPAAVYNANLQLTKWREFALEQKRIQNKASQPKIVKKETAQQRINRIFR